MINEQGYKALPIKMLKLLNILQWTKETEKQ